MQPNGYALTVAELMPQQISNTTNTIMSKALYLSLPEHIRNQLVLGDKLRHEMDLYVFGGYTPERKPRKRKS